MDNSKLKQLCFSILLLASFLLGNANALFAQSYVQSAVIHPTVSSTIPANKVTGVTLGQTLSVTFSAAMTPSTINSTNFTLTGHGRVSGTVAYDANSHIATFTPNAPLRANTLFKASISRKVADSLGHEMKAVFRWSFTTGAASDTTPPSVISTLPIDTATVVPLNQKITATFNEAMNPLTITAPATFTLEGPGTTSVAGTVSYSGNTAILAPTSPLAASTLFSATITTAATDLDNNALPSNFTWSFTTGTSADSTPPTVTSTNPALAATGVCTDHAVNATFSKAMDPSTISTATFTVKKPNGVMVPGTVSYDAATQIGTFTALSKLGHKTLYTATITTGAEDLAANALANDYVWTFTTGTGACQAQMIDLRSAASFAIIAASGVTSIPLTTINGNIALSPTFTITGGPVVNGTIYGSPDPIAVRAQHDNTLAYNTAAGLPNGVIISTGELGGLTLAPGLYKSGVSSFAITSSDLTLDAQGDSKATFIFQMPSSTLTVLSNRRVILSGGAKATNVFWQVGSSATLGANCSVEGTILALASVTLDTGALLEGRAFAQTAAVTLDTNTVSVPAP